MIERTAGGWIVKSEHLGRNGKRKNLSKVYKTRGEAEKRLAMVEWFKSHPK